ncbi:MAG: YkvA family protein [Nocardioides sp.]
MTEQNWKPLFRTPTSTVTKILRSHAFLNSRERSTTIVESSDELRALADLVETLDQARAPLAAIADRVGAAVRFLRDLANRLDDAATLTPDTPDMVDPKNAYAQGAGVAARERLLVASLHYLVTPDDLVPDFQAGGYIDDVFLLSWVFGVATNELTRFLTDDPQAGNQQAIETA